MHELSEHDHLEGLDQDLRVRRREIETVGPGIPRSRKAGKIEAIGQDRDPRLRELQLEDANGLDHVGRGTGGFQDQEIRLNVHL